MSYAADAVRAFHEAFKVGREGRLESIDEVASIRLTLHHEEAGEVLVALAAVADSLKAVVDQTRFGDLVLKLREALEALAGELADDLVVAYGTAELLGIDLDVAFRLKMEANMAKLPVCDSCEGGGTRGVVAFANGRPSEPVPCPVCHGTGHGPPIKRDDGKILRPSGWAQPSMADAVKS